MPMLHRRHTSKSPRHIKEAIEQLGRVHPEEARAVRARRGGQVLEIHSHARTHAKPGPLPPPSSMAHITRIRTKGSLATAGA
mmetsp:Transcript_27196/g.82524  ORF Transcript_27196/g.82524 Transcript_27196/m.82524 type:complete len:82 (-) Transcript_27196:2095-2340(-)|eukprot:scaffold300170_cov30-Tisochrysis_lutea.AAC.3